MNLDDPPSWTLLSRHAHALIRLQRDPHSTLRDLGRHLGITERSAQKIVGDLEAAGLLARRRVGRRNAYDLYLGRPLRHPLESDLPARTLIEPMLRSDRDPTREAS